MNSAPTSPWRVSDVMSLVAALLVGAVAILVGWIGVSGEPAPARQTGWMNVGIAGLVIAGVGTAVWLMTARRAIGQRRRQLLADVATGAGPAGPDSTIVTRPETLVALPGMTRYHRSSCELVAGKGAKSLTGRHRRSTTLMPCGVCQPDAMDDGTQ